MNEAAIPYGGGIVRLPLRGRLKVVEPPRGTPLADLASAAEAALERPTAGAPLRELVRPGEPVTLVVSDHTRATGAEKFLPPLLRYLFDSGVSRRQLSLLFATGIHRRQTRQEQMAIVGSEIGESLKLVDHDADAPGELVHLGVTGRGTPVAVNTIVADGRLVVVTGTVSPHYLAGFGGGRKSLIPGVAARETIVAVHRCSLAEPAGSGRHPQVRAGVVDGNPFDWEARAAAAMIERTFLLDTGMTPGGEVAALFSGALEPAFDCAARWCADHLSVTLPRRFQVVVAGAGGRPRDCNLVQAHKALEAACEACVPGGVVVLVAECGDGLGNERITEWFDCRSSRDHEARLRQNFEVNGFTALALRLKTERFRVLLCSSLPDPAVRKLGMLPVRPDEIWDHIHALAGAGAEGVVLPGGAVQVLVRAGA